jgi:hypothetical protein
MEGVSITYAADGCVMGSWKNVSIVVWGTPATMPLVSELNKLSEMIIAAHPKVSTIQMIVQGAGVPDSETRAAIDKLIESYASNMTCNAMLIEGSGFWASAMRGFLTSLQLLQRHRVPLKMKTCATVREIAAWLPAAHSSTGVMLDADELTRVLASFLEHPALMREQR